MRHLLILALLIGCNRGEPVGGSAAEAVELPPSPRLYRLTHAQWEASAQDLLALDAPTGLSEDFLGDTLSEGFDNNGDALRVDPLLFQDYQRAAELLSAALVVDPDRYALVVPQDPREGGSDVDHSERIEGEDSERVSADNGAAYNDLYLLWSNGQLRVDAEVPDAGRYTYTVRLYGSYCDDGVAPTGGLLIDGATQLRFHAPENYSELSVEVELSAGWHTLAIEFDNDGCSGASGDRNLYIDWLQLEGGGFLGASEAGEDEARAWIAERGARAHRRPLTDGQVDAYYRLFERGPELVGSGDDFADGVRLVLSAWLQSPWFVYRSELSTGDGDAAVLSDHEVASKLAFALWNAPPDDALRAAAEAGELSTEEQVAEQARRMLDDPRAAGVLDDFHGQLYSLDNVDDLNREDHPAWSEGMGPELREETERFIREVVLVDGGGVSELFSAPWSVLNARLAAIYGVEGPAEGWARVELPVDERAGLLTQASFLAPRSDSVNPSPIQRGVFVNRKVLCIELPDPPDDASGLPPLTEGTTNRQRVDAHTGEGTCGGSCHSYLINPPGFAFETYDPLGAWRDQDNNLPVDPTGEFYFSDGLQSWQDGPDLAALLSAHPDTHLCYAQRWLSYTHARPVDELDVERLAPLAERSADGLPITELLVALVSAESFRSRSDEEGS